MITSKKYVFAILSACFLFALALPAPLRAASDVPKSLNYQGYLTDNLGQPITGSHDITFNLYTALSGGTSFWTEVKQGVQVNAGRFAVVLGKTTALDLAQFTGETFIGIKVDGGAEMVPRQQFTSVAYALKAGSLMNMPAAIPTGGIIMWSGSTVPDGWALCNGQNGTPNLTDKFIVGAGNQYNTGAGGGEAMHILTLDEMPSHTHSQSEHTHIQDAHNHLVNYKTEAAAGSIKRHGTTSTGDTNQPTQSTTAINRSAIAINQNTGGGVAHNNLPPYFALAFIMKL